MPARKFGEAFARLKTESSRHQSAAWFAEKARGIKSTSVEAESLFELGVRMAKTLHELGERQDAGKLVKELQTLADKDHADRWAYLFAIKEELGWREQALQDATQALQDLQGRGRLFYDLFGDEKQDLAHQGWDILRELSSTEDVGTTFSKLRSLLDPQAALPPGLSLAEMVAGAERGLPELKLERQAYRMQAMGELCSARGATDLAVRCFETQGLAAEQIKDADNAHFRAAPWRHMGDAFARALQWRKAAEAYDRAWKLDRHNAATLYLQGFALKKAGDAKGQKLIGLALMVPLADTVKRREMAEIMERQGEKFAALTQQELILRLGADEFWEGEADWAIRYADRVVAEQVETVDPLRAASLRQRAILYLLKTNSGHTEAGEYAVTVHQIHRARAIGLLRAGQVDESIKELKEAQRARPGEIGLVLLALPLLTTARQDAVADALFTVAYDSLEKVCQEFPRSANHHHELARLCAGTGRKLGEAEQHALTAAKMDPANVAYTLTLADTYAKNGKRDMAIAVLQAAIVRHPKQAELRQQLEKLAPK